MQVAVTSVLACDGPIIAFLDLKARLMNGHTYILCARVSVLSLVCSCSIKLSDCSMATMDSPVP